ncbi:hypothetical protein RND71_036967 [Anisodus tanguticus]|uniref:Uncharacterized protein n=1 Tax=Anisodus tanguticus TaxID=243964 RepID=A0AAE1R2G3_9SOLA|nr:hypothetical protein RND71_036967 [Anisodus tanguticus]
MRPTGRKRDFLEGGSPLCLAYDFSPSTKPTTLFRRRKCTIIVLVRRPKSAH